MLVKGVLKSCEIDLSKLLLNLSVSASKFAFFVFSNKSSLSIASATWLETDFNSIFSFSVSPTLSIQDIPITPRVFLCPFIGKLNVFAFW